MDEIVDVVDEGDKIIGQESKSRCHSEGMLHRGAAILVFEDDSYTKTIIQKRSMNKTSNPGKFCIPGGHLSSGEDYITGARRELQEELFHQQELPKKIRFEELFKIKKSTDDDFEFNMVYRVVYNGDFQNDLDESENYLWRDIQEILKNIQIEPEKYTETTMLLLKEYQKRFM
ncbi:NUDIX domain-containing protein [Candidatus Woesearchaeota archaeon]|nr:NUDIX domain-containing protein [Candidatus Woesearchaeota archaeon]